MLVPRCYGTPVDQQLGQITDLRVGAILYGEQTNPPPNPFTHPPTGRKTQG